MNVQLEKNQTNREIILKLYTSIQCSCRIELLIEIDVMTKINLL